MAWADRAAGRTYEALRLVRESLALEPDSPRVQAMLRELEGVRSEE